MRLYQEKNLLKLKNYNWTRNETKLELVHIQCETSKNTNSSILNASNECEKPLEEIIKRIRDTQRV